MPREESSQCEPPMVMVGVSLALFIVLAGVFAPLLSPHDPLETDYRAVLCPPPSCEHLSGIHVLGTDHLGRDVLSYIVTSFRMYLYIGLVGTVLGIFVAYLLIIVRSAGRTAPARGAATPLLGGRFWLVTILTYLIGGYSSLMAMSLYGPSLMLVIGCVGVASSVLPMTFVYESLRMNRAPISSVRLDVRHAIMLAPVCLSLASIMGLLIESSLSFLGVGVPPPNPSLGNMIRDGVRTSLAEAPWVWGFPLGIILIAVGALSVIVIHRSRCPSASTSAV